MSWLVHLLGIDNEAGRYYAFWSGFGSDMSEVTLIGLVFGAYRQHNCEVKGCWRLGRHATAAGHKVCRKHHPDDHLTAGQVAADHETAKGAR